MNDVRWESRSVTCSLAPQERVSKLENPEVLLKYSYGGSIPPATQEFSADTAETATPVGGEDCSGLGLGGRMPSCLQRHLDAESTETFRQAARSSRRSVPM